MAATTLAPREQLLATAARLFYQHGYRAVGVDTIVAESRIGKMTLYRHFPSKDDLIVAYLEASNVQFWAWFDGVTGTQAAPREKLLAFFRALADLATKPSCYGCPFLNIVTEYPERDYPGHRVALAHKAAVRARFRELAAQAGAQQPDLLADQLFLLMDGAFMAVRMFGPESPAAAVAITAQTLIDGQME